MHDRAEKKYISIASPIVENLFARDVARARLLYGPFHNPKSAHDFHRD